MTIFETKLPKMQDISFAKNSKKHRNILQPTVNTYMIQEKEKNMTNELTKNEINPVTTIVQCPTDARPIKSEDWALIRSYTDADGHTRKIYRRRDYTPDPILEAYDIAAKYINADPATCNRIMDALLDDLNNTYVEVIKNRQQNNN